MKPQIALTPDQIQELRSLGLDYSDASMYCINDALHTDSDHSTMTALRAMNKPTPVYTLENILMKLPNTIAVESPDSSGIIYYDLVIFPHWKSGLWRIKYKNRLGDLKSVMAKDILKCAFEMLKWVLKNHPDKIKRL